MNRDLQVFEQVLQRVRAGDFHMSSSQIYVNCPLCGDEKRHLQVHSVRGLYICFRCREGGSIRWVISGRPADWREVRSALPDTKKDPFQPRPCTEEGYIAISPPLVTSGRGQVNFREKVLRRLADRAFSYCLKRGMTPAQIALYRLAVRMDYERVFFPYWNRGSDWTFYTARALGDEEPKTLEMPGSDKPLYGRQLHQRAENVVLVEGVFDHFVTPYSYAMMGAILTVGQIRQLMEDKVKRVFFIGDPDAGEMMERNQTRMVHSGITAYTVHLHTKKDPAEIGRAQMFEIVNNLLRGDWYSRLHRPIHVRL